MANNIETVGWISDQAYRPTVQYPAILASSRVEEGGDQPQSSQANLPSSSGAEYVQRLTAKERLATVAANIQEAGRVLEQAGSLLNRLGQAVEMVKNYPPYPPGNSQRQDYINSLNGLRKEIESLVFPPVEQPGQEFVFFPNGKNNPPLDPLNAADAEVAGLGELVRSAEGLVSAGFEGLRGLAGRMSATIIHDLPTPPANDEVASQLGESLASRLAQSGQGLLVRDFGLVRMSG